MKNNIKSQFPFSLFKLSSPQSVVLYVAMFVMGACGLAYEYTLSKVASDILGNSVRQWAIIIGIMMFFMGVGSDLQKYFSNKNLFDKFISFELLLGLLGAFGPIALLFFYGRFPSHYILVQYFFIVAIGLIIGFEIPLITRINEQYITELKINLAGVLKMDYIGSLAGSLVWIFVLPKFFTIIQMAFVLGIFNLLVGIFTLIYFGKLVKNKIAISLFSVLALVLVIVGFFSSHTWTSNSEQYLYRDRIISSHTTPYQHIVLTESPTGDISCYINGNLQFNSYDEYIYHEHLVHPAMSIAPNRENVLVLGGGDGLAVREILKYPDVKSVTVCDIDPYMTELAQNDLTFQMMNHNSLINSKTKLLKNSALVPDGSDTLYVKNQHKRYAMDFEKSVVINIINLDASKFIEQISGRYDVIIIDFPDPNSIDLAKLYSTEFYHHLKTKLTAYGIFVQQSTSSIHAKEAYLCIGRTMTASGLTPVPFHDNVPSFGEWGWWIGGRDEKYSEETIKTKMRSIQLDVQTRYLNPDLISASLIFGNEQLLSTNNDINTNLNNKVYEYYIKAWQHQ